MKGKLYFINKLRIFLFPSLYITIGESFLKLIFEFFLRGLRFLNYSLFSSIEQQSGNKLVNWVCFDNRIDLNYILIFYFSVLIYYDGHLMVDRWMDLDLFSNPIYKHFPFDDNGVPFLKMHKMHNDDYLILCIFGYPIHYRW